MFVPLGLGDSGLVSIPCNLAQLAAGAPFFLRLLRRAGRLKAELDRER